MAKSFIFTIPTKIVYRKDAVKEVGFEVNALKAKKALIVTDKILATETDIIEKVKNALGERFVGVFDEVEPDTGCDIVNKGYEISKKLGVDCIISVGGGSSMDTAKGIAIVMQKGGKIEDYSGTYILEGPTIPHIAIPTTAGTGSEVTYVAVIKDKVAKKKNLYVDNYIIPNVAILDPVLTFNLPPSLTAYTGADALVHCIEAIHSTQSNPISDALAMHGIRLIKDSLPVALENPQNISARGNMLIAACIAGAAFMNAQVGVVHALAHSIGARHGVQHGLANAIVLPHGMKFNLEVCPRYALVAEAFGAREHGMSDEEAAEKSIEVVTEFLKKLGIPRSLKEVGVPENDLGDIAELAMRDGAIVTNPKFAIDKNSLMGILREAYKGF